MGGTQLRKSSRPAGLSAGSSSGRSSRAARYRHARVARSAAPWAFGALLVLAPQALGGIYPDAMVAIAIASGACLALALLSARSVDLPTNLVLAVALAPLVWTVVQVLPLPCGLVEWLSPLSASRLRETHALLKLGPPGTCTLTRDPAGTREEVVKMLAIACGWLTAATLAARGEQRSVFRAVAASTVLMAVVALGHHAVDAERVFGWYEPIELRQTPMLAPLLNPNNLGGFLALGVPLLMGLAFEEESPRLRIALLVVLGLVAATALMTRSRGAAGAVAVGPALYALIAMLRTRGDQSRSPRTPPWLRNATAGGIAVVLGLACWVWFDELAAEFEGSGWDKLDLIGHAARFATTVPWVGAGRGAFAPAFVNALRERYRFDYAESLFVQWAVDWGIPATLALSAAVAVLWARAARRARSHTRVGAVAAVATVVLQNQVDLGLELLGPALITACLFAACASFPRSANRSDDSRARVLWAIGGALALTAMVAPALVATRLIAEHGPSVEQQLTAMVEGKDRARFQAVMQRAMLAHPSEPMLAIIGAQAALAHREPNAGRFINRGMQLAPGWPAPHVQAAQWLWNRGMRRQALIELRAGAELHLHGVLTILCPMAIADPAGVIEVGAPRNESRPLFLELVARCLPRSSEHTVRIDEELMRTAPRSPEPYVRQAQRLLREQRWDEAAKAAEVAGRNDPSNEHAATIAAQAYASLGKAADAYRVLEQGLQHGADPSAIYLQMARVAVAAKDRQKMKEAFELLRGWAGTDPKQLEAAYRHEAVHERELGNLAASLAAYEQAYRVANSPEVLGPLARAAEQLGDKRRALRAWTDLCALGEAADDACKRRDRLRTSGLKP